jgi:hypothetical protein
MFDFSSSANNYSGPQNNQQNQQTTSQFNGLEGIFDNVSAADSNNQP